MKSDLLRKKFIEFFKKHGHKLYPPAPLVFTEDPSVLFTTAGVQQFRSYFLAPREMLAKNIITIQPCFRTSDIEAVGDEKHLTFFEMLGNFSFGSYGKEEAIKLAWEFLTRELKIPQEKLSVTALPEDLETIKIWRKILPEEKIIRGSKEENFWGPIGDEGPCGPCTEILSDGLELWNLVFNEYYQTKEGKLKALKFKGVDTGMGLERLAVVVQKVPTVYETDLFRPLVKKILEISQVKHFDYEKNPNVRRQVRIIADHLRGIVPLVSEGLVPSNKLHGYVLRRLIRRAVAFGRLLGIKENFLSFLAPLVRKVSSHDLEIIDKEEENFSKTLNRGFKELEKILSKKPKVLSGKTLFFLYDTYGFPLELSKEIAQEKGFKVDERGFQREMEKQRERARKAQKILKVARPNPKLHTACHLLHQALRDILGRHIKQAGQDITGEELRFDFTHLTKLSEKELEKIEKIVNQKIKENLPVKSELVTLKEAQKKRAIALFLEKYKTLGGKLKLYSIGDYSKELCAGPHVKRTGELGQFKITSEKSAASGIRRIKAKVG